MESLVESLNYGLWSSFLANIYRIRLKFQTLNISRWGIRGGKMDPSILPLNVVSEIWRYTGRYLRLRYYPNVLKVSCTERYFDSNNSCLIR